MNAIRRQNDKSRFLRILKSAAITIAALSLLCRPSVALAEMEHASEVSKADEEKYAAIVSLGESYRAEGNLGKAVECCKNAANTPHLQYSVLARFVKCILQKEPTNADAHIALGLIAMNYLDPRYRGKDVRVPERSWLAECEFKTAIYLSPNHKNAEAELLLIRLAELQTACEIESHQHFSRVWYATNFFESLLAYRWKPPKYDGYLSATIETKWFSGTPELFIQSASPDFDASVMAVMKQSLEEFPWLFGGNLQFQFVAGEGVKAVDEAVLGGTAFIDPLLSQEGEKGESLDCTRILLKYFPENKLSLYCRPDTEYAYKKTFFNMQTQPDVMLTGTLYPDSSVGKVEWYCGTAKGKRLIYTLRTDKWTMTLDPQNLPTNIDDFLIQQRVRDALFSCMINYEIIHFTELDKDEWAPRQPADADSHEIFIRSNSTPTTYRCRLKDGRIVTAKLNPDCTINSVFIDGKFDSLWTTAYKEAVNNIWLAKGARGPGIYSSLLVVGRETHQTETKMNDQSTATTGK